MHAQKFAHGVILAFQLLLTQTAHAQDTDRVDQLKTEVLVLKQGLARIESSISGTATEQKPVILSAGWRSLAACRELKTGRSSNQERAILGDPARIDGGELASWKYPNLGRARFFNEALDYWTEPN